jgi:hypothetical protein
MQKHSGKLEGLYKYLVAGLILAVPLFPKFPFISIPGTFVSVRLEDFLLAITLVIWIYFAMPNLKKIITNDITLAIILFLAAGLIATLFGILTTNTVVAHIGLIHWLRRVEYFSAFFIGYLAIKNNPKDIGFYLKLFLIVIFLAFIYGYGQKYFSWPIIITQTDEYSKGIALRWTPGSHIGSTFAGHYDLATYLILVLPFFITTFFLIKAKLKRFLLLVVIFSGLWLLVNTASRISQVSYLISSAVALILVKKYKQIIILVIISMIFISLSSNLISRYTGLFDIIKGRIVGMENVLSKQVSAYAASEFPIERRVNLETTPTPVPVIEDRSTSIRLNVEWPRAIRALFKNPLLGTGYSSISLATDNDYLRALGEVGLLGFAAFILIFIRIIRKFLLLLPLTQRFNGFELAFIAGLLGSFIGIFMNAFFIDVFEASKLAITFWLFTGLAIGLINSKNYD